MDMELNLFKYHKFSSELFWLAWKMIHNQTNLLTRSERDHYVHKEEGMREQMFLGKKEKFDMTVVGDIGRVLRDEGYTWEIIKGLHALWADLLSYFINVS